LQGKAGRMMLDNGFCPVLDKNLLEANIPKLTLQRKL